MLNRLDKIIIPKEEDMDNVNLANIDQFSAADLRVAKITDASNVERCVITTHFRRRRIWN